MKKRNSERFIIFKVAIVGIVIVYIVCSSILGYLYADCGLFERLEIVDGKKYVIKQSFSLNETWYEYKNIFFIGDEVAYEDIRMKKYAADDKNAAKSAVEEKIEKLPQTIESISKDYGVDIYYKEADLKKLSEELNKRECYVDVTDNIEKVSNAVDDINVILERIQKGFLKEFFEGNEHLTSFDKIDVVLCKNLKAYSVVDENELSGTNGMYKNSDSHNIVYIAINIEKTDDVKQCFSKELAEQIYGDILTEYLYKNRYEGTENSYAKWKACEPEDFKYIAQMESDEIKEFWGKEDIPYCYSENGDKENIYFISKCGMIDATSSFSEVFSYLLACDSASDLPEAYDCPHIQEKAKLVTDMMDETFESVDESAYWTKLYEEKKL